MKLAHESQQMDPARVYRHRIDERFIYSVQDEKEIKCDHDAKPPNGRYWQCDKMAGVWMLSLLNITDQLSTHVSVASSDDPKTMPSDPMWLFKLLPEEARNALYTDAAQYRKAN